MAELQQSEYKKIEISKTKKQEIFRKQLMSEAEFQQKFGLSKYAEKYDLLCKGASAGVFIQKLEALMENGDTGLSRQPPSKKERIST